jgi:hypothetical protein
MRKLSRTRLDRVEHRLARLARSQAQARTPAGPTCAVCGRVQDPQAPPWTPAGWPLVDGPPGSGLQLCFGRCDAPLHLAPYLAAHARAAHAHARAPADAADADAARAVSRMVGLARSDRRWGILWDGVLAALTDLDRRAVAAGTRRPDDGGPDAVEAAVAEAAVAIITATVAELLAQAETDPDGAAQAVRLDAIIDAATVPPAVGEAVRARAQAVHETLLARAAERLRQGPPLPDPHTAAWPTAVARAREALMVALVELPPPTIPLSTIPL